MIRSIIFRGSWAKRLGKEDTATIDLLPGVNILSGPNGCGKSTVLRGLIALAKKTEESGIEVDADPCQIMALDFERHNPRTKSYIGTSARFQISSMFLSHGETNRALVGSISKLEKGSVVLLDEPDQALDFDGIKMLIRELKKGKFVQAIVAAHHPVIVLEKSFNTVEMRPGFVESMRRDLKLLTRLNKKTRGDNE